MELLDIAGLSFAAGLARFILAAGCIYLILRWLAWINRKPFSAVQEIIYANPLAAALYRGAVFFSLCFLAGSILS
jgi:uncharacterized membrane protein YedE/YeeE